MSGLLVQSLLSPKMLRHSNGTLISLAGVQLWPDWLKNKCASLSSNMLLTMLQRGLTYLRVYVKGFSKVDLKISTLPQTYVLSACSVLLGGRPPNDIAYPLHFLWFRISKWLVESRQGHPRPVTWVGFRTNLEYDGTGLLPLMLSAEDFISVFWTASLTTMICHGLSYSYWSMQVDQRRKD